MDSSAIENVLNQYVDPSFSETILYDDYRYWLESTVELNKPDFVILLNLKAKNPIVYSKNFNLRINNSDSVTISDIIDSVDPNQIDGILEADQHFMKFLDKNDGALNNTVLQLRFTSFLDPTQPKSFLRNISIIPRYRNNSSFTLLLVSLIDITELLGVQAVASTSLRYIRGHNNDLSDKLEKLKKELNIILKPSVKLTKREKQILKLIGLGKTSDRIALDLSISVNTVNTHRQNLIRKFKVRNTAALLNLI